jgi:hypothetical protein
MTHIYKFTFLIKIACVSLNYAPSVSVVVMMMVVRCWWRYGGCNPHVVEGVAEVVAVSMVVVVMVVRCWWRCGGCNPHVVEGVAEVVAVSVVVVVVDSDGGGGCRTTVSPVGVVVVGFLWLWLCLCVCVWSWWDVCGIWDVGCGMWNGFGCGSRAGEPASLQTHPPRLQAARPLLWVEDDPCRVWAAPYTTGHCKSEVRVLAQITAHSGHWCQMLCECNAVSGCDSWEKRKAGRKGRGGEGGGGGGGCQYTTTTWCRG